ncbi:hypothetical protein [Nonomuraea typhae]|uniref:Uncharacterized protein n=1 Tax=Nonomuraea typhae TaxID=2603600 RepID=A0ABW7YJB5_9ACTN
MASTDPLDQRDFDREVKRHTHHLKMLTNHIQERIEHVATTLAQEEPGVVAHDLRAIYSDVGDALERMAALDALKQVQHIVHDESTDKKPSGG